MVEFCGGKPEMVCWLLQEVVPCILNWRWYWEMGSSLCGMVQFARKAGNLDDTTLDRDRPVTWEGKPKKDRSNYIKFPYHRGTTHAVLLCIVMHKTQAEWQYTLLEETAPKPLENPDHPSLCWVKDFYFKNDIILITYCFNYIKHWSLSLHKRPAGAPMHTALPICT